MIAKRRPSFCEKYTCYVYKLVRDNKDNRFWTSFNWAYTRQSDSTVHAFNKIFKALVTHSGAHVAYLFIRCNILISTFF